MKDHILIVDHDPLLQRNLALSLRQAGLHITTATTAAEAVALIQQAPPDLILLDTHLRDLDWLAALHRLRTVTDAPILFVAAQRCEAEEALCLEAGADDYLAPPFDQDVLLARIHVALRHTQPAATLPNARDVVQVGDLVIDPKRFTATVQGKALTLSAREFALLTALAHHAGQVLSLEALISQVWGADYEGEAQAVYIYIRTLRSKLAEAAPTAACRIVTVRGAGYKLTSAAA
ncbi:MAG: DNA-binding response regulator [Caldilinea sp. CFX5]|nr:DNA-binding response regulator [Caldilinea sp. CFX5]